LAGGCIWHWCDQGLYRDAEPGEFAADAGHPIDGKVYLSPERLMDSNGNMGSDGIVYADRRPQVDYWQTRNVFSPVQIAERTLSAQPGRQTIAITVTNRYDFTDLAANRFTWRLFKNREILGEGSLEIALAPHQTRKVPLAVDIPADTERNDLRIEIVSTDDSGIVVCEHVVELSPKAGAIDYRKVLEDEQRGNAVSKLPPVGLRVDRASGKFALAEDNKTEMPMVEGVSVRAGRRPTMAERQVRKRRYADRDFFCEPYVLSAAQDGCVVTRKPHWRAQDWRIQAHYPRMDKADQEILGKIDLHEDRRGWIDLTYDLHPNNATGLFLEAGVTLRLSPSLTEFRWLGDGPYYSYPGTDEAAQHGVHHVSSDGLYFEGNRTRVELLAATDAAGNGVGILCEPSNIGWEVSDNGVLLSHSALVSGRGNKGEQTRYSFPAAKVSEIQGRFRLIRLEAGHWPAVFLRVFGSDAITEKPEPSPYIRVYD
jgi:beta-galactosidase